MSTPQTLALNERRTAWIGFLVLLAIAVIQCVRITHDLLWAFDVDFDRDMSFVQGTLDGAYGKDPSYLNEWLWYNPLLFLLETAIVKLTGLPVNIVLARAGVWLNILGPICFFAMCLRLFNPKIALAASLSYLFLSSGKILLVLGATYTPWLYPSAFMLFAFYLDILLLYKAFSSGKYGWFAGLGLAVGITFLGHAAPAIILVGIMAVLQAGNILAAFRQKQSLLIRRYLLQGLLAFACFCLAVAPIFYYIFGKYHLHIINREPSEYTEGLFYINHLWGLFKANFSIAMVVSVVGLVSFYRSFPQGLVRKIVVSWLFISLGLYLYATLSAGLDHRYGLRLPAMVPSFHYFIYLKAIQSLFFGFGLIFLLNLLNPVAKYWLPAIVLIAIVNLPFYLKREDFVVGRQLSIAKQDDKDKQQVYSYILHNLSPDKVVLCEKDPSLFPVMATGRKMVSNAFTFSNPYVDFTQRENDRDTMIGYIVKGENEPLQKLLSAYKVDYILLSREALGSLKPGVTVPGKVVLQNRSYTLFACPSMN